MSDKEDDLWAVQVSSDETMVNAAHYSQIIVATDGSMTRMNSFSPEMFTKTKESLWVDPSRCSKER